MADNVETKPEKNTVKSSLEPRQRNGFMVPCLKHGTTIEPISKSGWQPYSQGKTKNSVKSDPSVRETSSLSPKKIFRQIDELTTLKSILPMLESTHRTWITITNLTIIFREDFL